MKRISLILVSVSLAVFPHVLYNTNTKSTELAVFEKTKIIEQAESKKEEVQELKIEEIHQKQNPKVVQVEEPSTTNEVIEKSEAPKPVSTNSLNEITVKNDPLGTAGRLYIPEVNINVGLNHADFYAGDGYNAQAIVDKEDSAAYFLFANKTTIADHNHQGFNRIANLNSSSKAYIKNLNGTIKTYQLVNKFVGKNISTDLVDNAGNSVQNMNGSLIMYTCYGLGNGVMVTLWNPLG